MADPEIDTGAPDIESDKLTIAEAIARSEKGKDETPWYWKRCHCWNTDKDVRKVAGPCPTCSGTGRVPDIGEHNILRVIEWARKQEWPTAITPSTKILFPREEIHRLFKELLFAKIERSVITTEIISTIAQAIRQEGGEG